jgi:hypothetical protein
MFLSSRRGIIHDLSLSLAGRIQALYVTRRLVSRLALTARLARYTYSIVAGQETASRRSSASQLRQVEGVSAEVMVDVETNSQVCAMESVVYLCARRGCMYAAWRQRGARSMYQRKGDERVSTELVRGNKVIILIAVYMYHPFVSPFDCVHVVSFLLFLSVFFHS